MRIDHIVDSKENKEFVEPSDRLIDDDELITLEGENFARFGELAYIEREEAERSEEEARVAIEPVDYKFVEQMKKEGVSEEPAVSAFSRQDWRELDSEKAK